MKKITIISILIMACYMSVAAQGPDTITAAEFNYWGGIVVDDPLCTSTDEIRWRVDLPEEANLKIGSKEYVPIEPITLYGLAGIYASFSLSIDQEDVPLGHPVYIEDTVLSHAFDSLILHTFETSNYSDPNNYIRRIKQVKICRGDNPVKYLYLPNVTNPQCDEGMLYDTSRYFPIREAYFDTPVVVADTFYISPLMYNSIYYEEHNEERLATRSFCPMCFVYENGCSASSNIVHIKYDTSRHEYFSIIRIENISGYILSYFPILTPPPAVDTTGHGGDTTAVEMVDGVGRYVSLTPNPAADRVQVLSSFGLKQVEAYNSEGKLVYADEAHGLSKTIDLAAWPRGIYLVRVITPMGSTTKKLVLR